MFLRLLNYERSVATDQGEEGTLSEVSIINIITKGMQELDAEFVLLKAFLLLVFNIYFRFTFLNLMH